MMLVPTGIAVELAADSLDEQMMNEATKVAMYRVVQEQLTNIVKYAQATMVTLTIGTDDQGHYLAIADNGIGTSLKGKKTGIGLRNIQSRVSVLHGKTEINSAPGRGFTVNVRIPLV